MRTKISSIIGLASASPLRRDAGALAIFFVLTLVMTNPLVLHVVSAVEDKQDALLNTWIIAWVGHALITDPLNLFNTNIFYPYPNTLAFSETMLPQGIFALPFNLAFDNTVLGYNLVLLASFFLAAYAMYLFVFDLTRHRPAAIVAGTIFAFNPYNLGNLAQAQLLSFGWLPLALLFLRQILGNPKSQSPNSQKPNPKCQDPNLKAQIPKPQSAFGVSSLEFRICFLFVFFFSLQALSSFYYAFLAGIAVVLYIGWFFATNRSRQLTFYALRFTQLTFSITLIALFITPFFLPYLQAQRDLGFERKVEESEPFSASLKLYTEVSPQNVLYGSLLAPRQLVFKGGYPLDNLFPGFVAVGLAIIGVVFSRHRDRWFYFILFAFAFLLSLGPRLYVTPTQLTDLSLPYRWLYDLFPLMRALRAPVRFDALVMFAMAVLAGVGAGKFQISNFKPQIWRHEIGITLVFVPLIALEYFAFPASQIAPVPVGNAIPEYVRWLRKQPPGVILELPMIASDPSKPLDLTTQYLSTYHWHQTPDGYSGFNPPRRGEIAYWMQFFGSLDSIRLLQALDVNYVIFHSDQFTNDGTVDTTDAMLIQQFGSDVIWSITPRVQDARALAPHLYLPRPVAPRQNYFAHVVVENPGPDHFAVKPTDIFQVDAQFSNGTTQHTLATMPLVTIGSRITVIEVRLTAPPSAGDYHLDLRMSSNAIGKWNLSGDLAVRDGEPNNQIVLPASVYAISSLEPFYAPGDAVNIEVVWPVYNKIDAYYSVSVRVLDANGNKIVSVDRQPRQATLLWQPHSEVPDLFTLALPRDIAPGKYSVQLKMYQADQGVDALLIGGNGVPHETDTLGTFTVK